MWLAVLLSACTTDPAARASLPTFAEPIEVGGGFYHLSQGSDLLPLDVFLHLERPGSTERFADGLERFGLIPDPVGPENPLGLPVGLAVSQPPGVPVKMLGQTCAACHVGEITWGETTVRIDGGPNLFQTKAFFAEFSDATRETFDDPAKLSRFIARYLGLPAESVTSISAPRSVLLDQATALVRRELDARAPSGSVPDGMEVRRRLLGGGFDRLERKVSGLPTFELPEAANDLLHAIDDKAEQLRIATGLARLLADVRLVDQALNLTDHYQGARRLPHTPEGPGRVDAFGTVRAQFLPQVFGDGVQRPLTAPVSMPHLWHVDKAEWLHWNANTNSALQRNILEAVGSGAVVEFDTFETWVNLPNLVELEALTYRMKPPPWPASFPEIDAEAAARGRAVFDGEGAYADPARGGCAACHATGPSPSRVAHTQHSLEALGTDPNHARDFDAPVGGGPFVDALAEVATKIEARYATTHGTDAATRASWEAGRTNLTWRSPVDAPLLARPLHGVWATAPYLHNGSVPTLWDLLLPEDQRPKRFPLGHRAYDPVRVGYRTDVDDPVWVFDVDEPVRDGSGAVFDLPNGNSNRGHAFGVALTDRERADLIAYLKTL